MGAPDPEAPAIAADPWAPDVLLLRATGLVEGVEHPSEEKVGIGHRRLLT